MHASPHPNEPQDTNVVPGTGARYYYVDRYLVRMTGLLVACAVALWTNLLGFRSAIVMKPFSGEFEAGPRLSIGHLAAPIDRYLDLFQTSTMYDISAPVWEQYAQVVVEVATYPPATAVILGMVLLFGFAQLRS